MAKINDTKVVTNEVRLVYLYVFKPNTHFVEDGKYEATLIIDPKDKETLDYVNQAINNAKSNGTKLSKPVFLGSNFKSPLKYGDPEEPNTNAIFSGKWYIVAKSTNKPKLVKKINGSIIEITDPEELQSGYYGLASLDFLAYDKAGNKGVIALLNSILYKRTGPVLGKSSPDSDYDDVDNSVEDDGLPF